MNPFDAVISLVRETDKVFITSYKYHCVHLNALMIRGTFHRYHRSVRYHQSVNEQNIGDIFSMLVTIMRPLYSDFHK